MSSGLVPAHAATHPVMVIFTLTALPLRVTCGGSGTSSPSAHMIGYSGGDSSWLATAVGPGSVMTTARIGASTAIQRRRIMASPLSGTAQRQARHEEDAPGPP